MARTRQEYRVWPVLWDTKIEHWYYREVHIAAVDPWGEIVSIWKIEDLWFWSWFGQDTMVIIGWYVQAPYGWEVSGKQWGTIPQG